MCVEEDRGGCVEFCIRIRKREVRCDSFEVFVNEAESAILFSLAIKFAFVLEHYGCHCDLTLNRYLRGAIVLKEITDRQRGREKERPRPPRPSFRANFIVANVHVDQSPIMEINVKFLRAWLS